MSDWVPFIREFGFPIAVLVAAAIAIYRRILVLGKDADQRVVDAKADGDRRVEELKRSHAEDVERMEAEKAYREERRVEERSNRLLTEETLRGQVTVMRDMTELLKDIERNIRSGA